MGGGVGVGLAAVRPRRRRPAPSRPPRPPRPGRQPGHRRAPRRPPRRPGRARTPSTRRTTRERRRSPQGVELFVETAGLADARQHGARVVRLLRRSAAPARPRGHPRSSSRLGSPAHVRVSRRPPGSMSARSGASASRAPAVMSSGSSSSSLIGSSSSSPELVVADGVSSESSSSSVVDGQHRRAGPGPRGRRCRPRARAPRRTGCAWTRRRSETNGRGSPSSSTRTSANHESSRSMIGERRPGPGQGATDQLGQVVEVLGVVHVEVEDAPAARLPGEDGGEVRHRHMVPLRR